MQNKDELKQLIQPLLKAVDLVSPEHRTKQGEYVDFLLGPAIEGEAKLHKDYYFHPGFEPDTAEYAFENLQVKSGDVLISNYPKTGMTWVSSIIKHIFGRKDPKLLQKYLDVSYFFLYLGYGPVSKYEVTENLPFERRLFGTHLPASLVNMKKYIEKGVKVIYIIRNPKDQAVSWYNFMMSDPLAKSENWKNLLLQDERKFFDLYFAGKQLVMAKKDECYLESIRQWYKHKDDENVFFLAFEELKKDPRGEIRKLAKFIGEELSEKELDWVAEKTSFSSMKKKSEDSGTQKKGLLKFYGKGQVGAWRNHLTVAQSELIDQKVERILGDTDIKFMYG